MDYIRALEYLKSLTKFGINMGLGRITELLKRLGNPHLKLKVIHVGGTNGKGSTTAMIASILRAGGYTVGTFTSPHLHSYNERFSINGQAIPHQEVAELLGILKPHLDNMVDEGFEHPTEFEVSTAMACCCFHRRQVDYAIFEVGMGGEIDSTNVVQPLVAVITNVSMDHMEYLGDTVAEIARVKAGIIKPGVPMVTAAEHPDALGVIRDVCSRQQAPLTQVGQDVTWQDQSIIGKHNTYPDIQLALKGEHQRVNAATAVAAVEALMEQGINLASQHVAMGLALVQWPGRFEVLPGQPTVVLDGAHNLAGARALVDTLKENFFGQRMVLVLGMLGDKERQKVIELLAPLAQAVVITKPNSPRAGDWRQAAQWAAQHCAVVYTCEHIPQGVDQGLALANPEDVVCVTGSLYMLAEAREYLLNKTT